MSKPQLARRQFLRGAQGFSLALPFLPSLLPRGVVAAPARQPVFVAITTVHGACRPENVYPSAGILTKSAEIHPGHTAKYGDLMAGFNGGRLSNVFRGAALTPKLVGKLNVLRGFDYPYYSGHHSGHLGNFAVNDQGPKGLKALPSIDQVMAWSPSFYKDPGSVKLRSIVAGRGGFQSGSSFTFSNPQAGSGTVSRMAVESNAGAIFDRAFAGGVKPTTPAEVRKPIVDRVIENYRSLRQGDRRLSAEDRQRLEDHVARLAELERVLKAAPARDCGDVKRPSGDVYQAANDVIVAAFSCGTSAVATLAVSHDSFHGQGGGYHQGTAHNAGSGGAQQTVTSVHQQVFEKVFLDLMKKMDDVSTGSGTTLLDDALVQWTQEAGWETHNGRDTFILQAGTAAGYFKTGLFVDYRGTKSMKMFGKVEAHKLGLLHRQWLATALQAMGVPPAEWEKYTKPGAGYGDPFMAGEYTAAQLPAVHQNASRPVPIITMA